MTAMPMAWPPSMFASLFNCSVRLLGAAGTVIGSTGTVSGIGVTVGCGGHDLDVADGLLLLCGAATAEHFEERKLPRARVGAK
mmetsp:Transcript_131139/g.419546  ORF Transcript_131139/g.419546 Transcript_131139/m.419546 type:complete len:83 (-) Transcript_131139:28-276(-)